MLEKLAQWLSLSRAFTLGTISLVSGKISRVDIAPGGSFLRGGVCWLESPCEMSVSHRGDRTEESCVPGSGRGNVSARGQRDTRKEAGTEGWGLIK